MTNSVRFARLPTHILEGFFGNRFVLHWRKPSAFRVRLRFSKGWRLEDCRILSDCSLQVGSSVLHLSFKMTMSADCGVERSLFLGAQF